VQLQSRRNVPMYGRLPCNCIVRQTVLRWPTGRTLLGRPEAPSSLVPGVAGGQLVGISRVYGPYKSLLSNLHSKRTGYVSPSRSSHGASCCGIV
jgi:hypothetical protein